MSKPELLSDEEYGELARQAIRNLPVQNFAAALKQLDEQQLEQLQHDLEVELVPAAIQEEHGPPPPPPTPPPTSSNAPPAPAPPSRAEELRKRIEALQQRREAVASE